MPASTQTFPLPTVAASQLVLSTAASSATITGGTIATSTGIAISNPAGAITGVILSPGTVDGQVFVLINKAVAANTITMAAVATSNVANGVTTVVVGLQCAVFVWSALDAAWFSVFH